MIFSILIFSTADYKCILNLKYILISIKEIVVYSFSLINFFLQLFSHDYLEHGEKSGKGNALDS